MRLVDILRGVIGERIEYIRNRARPTLGSHGPFRAETGFRKATAAQICQCIRAGEVPGFQHDRLRGRERLQPFERKTPTDCTCQGRLEHSIVIAFGPAVFVHQVPQVGGRVFKRHAHMRPGISNQVEVLDRSREEQPFVVEQFGEKGLTKHVETQHGRHGFKQRQQLLTRDLFPRRRVCVIIRQPPGYQLPGDGSNAVDGQAGLMRNLLEVVGSGKPTQEIAKARRVSLRNAEIEGSRAKEQCQVSSTAGRQSQGRLEAGALH